MVNQELSMMAGRIVESIVGTHLLHIPNVSLAHLPERRGEPEVDFVMTIGDRRIPLEVKYRRNIDPVRDLAGLQTFMDRTANNAPFAILVTQTEVRIDDPRVVCLPLPLLLSM